MWLVTFAKTRALLSNLFSFARLSTSDLQIVCSCASLQQNGVNEQLFAKHNENVAITETQTVLSQLNFLKLKNFCKIIGTKNQCDACSANGKLFEDWIVPNCHLGGESCVEPTLKVQSLLSIFETIFTHSSFFQFVVTKIEEIYISVPGGRQ